MDGPCAVVDPLVLLAAGADSLADGPVVVHDPVGGPIGVGVAEWLAGAGLTVALVTPDQIAGTLLSLTGDLAEANSRLQRAGVHRDLRSLLRGIKDGHALLEDCGPAKSRPSPARRSSTAAIGSPRSPSIWPDPGPCGPATAWPLAVSSRRCSKGDGWPSPSGTAGPPLPSRRPGGGGPMSAATEPTGRTGVGQGGADHRGRPRPGSQPRRAAGPTRGRHHRGGSVCRREGDSLSDGHAGRSGRDHPAGDGDRWLAWSARGGRARSRGPGGAVADGVDRLGRLDIAVANAGVCTVQRWDEVTPEVWDTVIGINLTGAWNTCVASIPHLIEAGGGSLILISSVAGLKGQPFLAPYVASKHGLVGVMRMLANELAARRIRVNSIHPTGVDTPMLVGLGGLGQRIAASPDTGSVFLNSLAVDLVHPEDVSEAVLYLASDESRYVTGLTLTVDAGSTAR